MLLLMRQCSLESLLRLEVRRARRSFKKTVTLLYAPLLHPPPHSLSVLPPPRSPHSDIVRSIPPRLDPHRDTTPLFRTAPESPQARVLWFLREVGGVSGTGMAPLDWAELTWQVAIREEPGGDREGGEDQEGAADGEG